MKTPLELYLNCSSRYFFFLQNMIPRLFRFWYPNIKTQVILIEQFCSIKYLSRRLWSSSYGIPGKEIHFTWKFLVGNYLTSKLSRYETLKQVKGMTTSLIIINYLRSSEFFPFYLGILVLWNSVPNMYHFCLNSAHNYYARTGVYQDNFLLMKGKCSK